MAKANEIKDAMLAGVGASPMWSEFVSTGSSILNLCLTDNPYQGFRKGSYVWLVGDSDTGKTFFSMTCFAEAAANSLFDGHRLVYDGKEGGAGMDWSRFFGKTAASRIECPVDAKGKMRPSDTIQELYYSLDRVIEDGRPCIYVQDSMDVLSSDSEKDKFDEQMTAHEKGKEVPGSYGDGKAKVNSQFLRNVVNEFKKNGSILVIISQTRDSLTQGGKTVSGGRALKFYADIEIWSSVDESIQKEVSGIKRNLGNSIKLSVKKNRYTGKKRDCFVPIFPTHGIDDIASCVNYLVDEKHWGTVNGRVNATEFQFNGFKSQLIEHIDKNDMVPDLRAICWDVWRKVEAALTPDRKPRYG